MAAWLAYLKSQLLLPPAERELDDAEAVAEDLGERLRRLKALRQAAAKIKGAQGDLLAWCNSSFLSKNTAKEMTRYLESFFEKADQLPVEQGRPKGSLR